MIVALDEQLGRSHETTPLADETGIRTSSPYSVTREEKAGIEYRRDVATSADLRDERRPALAPQRITPASNSWYRATALGLCCGVFTSPLIAATNLCTRRSAATFTGTAPIRTALRSPTRARFAVPLDHAL
eukprot:6035071-Prymnesium_polylepis.1